MNIDIDDVLKTYRMVQSQIQNGYDGRSLLHLDVVEIAARIRAEIRHNPMNEAEICYHFRRRGFGNTAIIEYMLNKFCRRSTRDYLWERDDFGRFHPANAHWRD